MLLRIIKIREISYIVFYRKYINTKLSFVALISNHYSLTIFASNFVSTTAITIIYFQSFEIFSLKKDKSRICEFELNLQLNKITVIKRYIVH